MYYLVGTMKLRIIKRALLILSLLINALLLREVIKYEPDQTRNRFWHQIRKTGWFDKRVKLFDLKSDSIMVVLAFGQSNAANSSEYYHKPKNNVLTYYNDKLYIAKEPLLGASGYGGSVWSLLGDQLIDSGIFKKVVIIPIAVAGSRSEEWVTGESSVKLKKILASLKKNNIQLTHILWHQGESDNGSISKQIYKQNLAAILAEIRIYKQDAPFYCSVATYSFNATERHLGLDSNLQNAQKEFISENKNVYRGADTDSLIYAIHRYDGQHFSEFGLRHFSKLWYRSIINSLEH